MKEMVRMKVCGKYQWILYILSNASKRKYAYVWYTGRNRWNKNRLEELRKERGIKQEELASAMEVSRQTIGSLENGRYNPSILLALKLAGYFGTSIEEIFIYEEEKHEEKW